MNASVPLMTVLYFGCSLLIIAMAILIRSRRPAPGYLPLTIFLVLSAIWIACSGLEFAVGTASERDLWAKATYCSLVLAGGAWLWFALDYAGSHWVRQWRNLLLLAVVPLGIIIFTLTYSFPATIWDEVAINLGALNFQGSTWLPKIVYMLSSFYQYFLYLFGVYILARQYRRKPRAYWPQITLLLVGTAIPLTGTVIEITMILPYYIMDISPFYLLVGTICYCVAFVGLRFLDILPVAYKTLIKDLPDGIIVIDQEGFVKEINPAAQLMLGCDRPDALNQSLVSLWPSSASIPAFIEPGLHSEFTTGDNNFPRHLDVRSVVLYGKQEKVVGKLVVLRDISQLKAVQSSLESLLAREHELRRNLEDEMQKRTQYSRAVVHELRNPLTSILASTELLEDQVKAPVQMALVKNIYRSSVNLEQRVNELFELARGEIGLIKLEPVDLDMARLINDVTAEMRPVAAAKGVVLRTDLKDPEIPCQGDKSRLRQVLANLIGNSIKFTDQGEIVVSAAKRPDGLQVSVTDSGRGIDPELMLNLFDPYKRLKKAGHTTTGLGIGLALCKIFIELHGGKIRAESAPGSGTTISFNLPFQPQAVKSGR